MIKFNQESIAALKSTKSFLTEKNLIGIRNELVFSISNMFKRTSRISKARPHDRTELYEEMNGNIIRVCSGIAVQYRDYNKK
jgi:hypothetical protein